MPTSSLLGVTSITSKKLENWLEEKIGFENPKLGLSRINKALELFPVGLENTKKVIVAGTNGKGSTSRLICNSINSKLNPSFNCALFTSPHLECITERFHFNGHNIEKYDLAKLFESSLEKLIKSNINLSYFEFLFFCFIQWVGKHNPTHMVLEVGLGGRFDATNTIDCDVAILTSIGRDHQEFLGSTYREILNEKIQVARKDNYLICSPDTDYLMSLIKKSQVDIGFETIVIDKKSLNFKQINHEYASKCASILGFNVIDELEDDFKIINGTKYHFYGSHNLAAVRKLVHYLGQTHYNNGVGFDLAILSFSKRSDRELRAMIELYKQLRCEVILTSIRHFKAIDDTKMKLIAKENGIEFVDYKNINKFSNNQSKNVLVSGSNYFVGDFKRTYI